VDKPLDFFGRLGMYVDAVGVESAKFAWDLASLPLGDTDHRELAYMLVKGPDAQ